MTKDIAYIIELLRIINDYELVIISACLIYYIIISISLYFIYLRIGKKKINALIPLLNIITLLDLVSLPRLLIILVFVPYINFIGIFIVSIIINYRLGKALSLEKIDRIGLILLPIIFMPLIATKHLEYTKLPPSRMLKEEEEIEEEEEFVLDVKYDIKDVDVGLAYDVSQFINEGMYKETKKDNKKDDVTNEVADLTFDYNDLYNSDGKVKKEENEKKEDNEDMNNQDINSQIPAMPGTINTNNLYSNQVGVQGVNVQPTQTYSTYNQQVMPTNGANGQMQQYSVAGQMPVQNQPIPGAVAQVQTIPVNPGVSTPNGPAVADVSQPVTQPAVEPYYPSQGLVNYTQDYNAIYNIQPRTYEEVKPVMTPIEPNQFNPTADGLTTVSGNAEQSINTLQMAAPPSFEQNTVEQNDIKPDVMPTMPVMQPVENLVSVNIVEPEALPVITPVKNNMEDPLGSNDLMNPSSFGDNNFDLLKPIDNNNYMNDGVMQVNGFENNSPNNFSPNMENSFVSNNEPFNSNQQFNYNNSMNNQYNQNQQFNYNNSMNDQYNQNQQFNYNNSMRDQFNYSNMDEQSNMTNSSRFIQTEHKEELPKNDYNIPQSTIDPIVMSDPMSVFGSSSGLRPTSNESLREPQITPGGNDVCPNCGFLVKPGQPSCVVCGYRFQ